MGQTAADRLKIKESNQPSHASSKGFTSEEEKSRLSNREGNNESRELDSRKGSGKPSELTSAKQWRRRKPAKQKAETPAIVEVQHSFVIDGQHRLHEKSAVDVKKNEYSALAPAGRSILKEDL